MAKKIALSNLWLGSLAFVFISHISFAAICSDLPQLNVEQCGHYDFIAYGRIDSELNCEENVVTFTPVSVFKGDSYESIKLFTPCSDKGLPLTKGEYWILYGDKNNAQEIHLSICGHSRNQVPKGEVDYQTDARGTSFQDDLSFLKNNFKAKSTGERELLPKKYEKIDPVMVPILIGIGLLFMIIGYFVMKKMGNNNSK